jgi:hypothetical protein
MNQIQPIESLFCYPFYTTRSEYQAKTGKVAPPFNPNRLVQNWEATNVTGDPVQFKVFDPSQESTGYISLLSVPQSLLTLNLPDTATAAAAMPIPINPPAQGYQIVPNGDGTFGVQMTGMLFTMLYPQLLPNGLPDENPTHGMRNAWAANDYYTTGIYNVHLWQNYTDEQILTIEAASEATVLPSGQPGK